MQTEIHYPGKDRKIAVTFPAPHRGLRVVPATTHPIAQATAHGPAKVPDHRATAHTQQTFSPLIQEFLDECGYTDK
jgi:hypothetical protein